MRHATHGFRTYRLRRRYLLRYEPRLLPADRQVGFRRRRTLPYHAALEQLRGQPGRHEVRRLPGYDEHAGEHGVVSMGAGDLYGEEAYGRLLRRSYGILLQHAQSGAPDPQVGEQQRHDRRP